MIGNLTRRAFLRLTAGNTLAFAATGLGRQFPANWISEPLPSEFDIKPVELIRYATTCRECPAGCGMHVHHINGRAIKAEGNPDHPVNRGGLCARGQSALQGLYDPDRITVPLQHHRGGEKHHPAREASWQEALTAIGKRLKSGDGRVVVLSCLETGTLAGIMKRFAHAFDGELLFYEPYDYRSQRQAYEAVIGEPVIPWYGLDRCETIVSFGADFLETWVSNVQYTRMFATMHDYAEGRPMGRFAYVGPRLSMTGANADEFIKVPPEIMYPLAMATLKVMAERGWVADDGVDYRGMTTDFHPGDLPFADAGEIIEKLAGYFANQGKSVALAGPMAGENLASRQLAEAVLLLNSAAGNFGATINMGRVHALGNVGYQEDVVERLGELGEEDVLIVHQANPVYAAPQLAEVMDRAGLVVALGQLADETSKLADWVLPVDNPLESWGEYSPWTGIKGYQQPTMNCLYDSRPAGDIVLSLADVGGRPLVRKAGRSEDLDFFSWLLADWRDGLPPAQQNDAGIRSLLRRGYSEEEPPEKNRLDVAPVSTPHAPPQKVQPAADSATLWVWPSIFHFDGRTANRSWLLENPQPVSFIAWGSWIEIHPEKARALGVEEGDGLLLRSQSGSLEAPARITSEIDQQTVGVPLGLGHSALGKTAAGLGVNGFALLGQENPGEAGFTTVSLQKSSNTEPAICLTSSRDQHEREILRWEKRAKMGQKKHGHRKVDMPLPEGFAKENDIYKGHEHAGHRWAMVIDLHRCIGCGACAIACYAENNIPVLGPGPVREGREMAWMKVIPYNHPEKKEKIGFLPLPCQHCDQAPCEPVCPVFASVHTEDGLNAQVYNRCIGTRYCSQNCPYKVRRFNWLNTSWEKPLEWQLNPEVTVRARGVMEKCTFCVQRIRHAEYRARREDRDVRDGEITPACVQSCPANVFTFGDLHNPDSAVSRLFRQDPRGYQLLHELNTKTAVLYLKRIEQE